MVVRPVAIFVPEVPALSHAITVLAVLLDEALFALGWRRHSVTARRGGVRFDFGRERRRATGTMALIRGLAGNRRRDLREAAERARVIDLDPISVQIGGNERIAGKEECVGAIGTNPEQIGAEQSGPRGD